MNNLLSLVSLYALNEGLFIAARAATTEETMVVIMLFPVM